MIVLEEGRPYSIMLWEKWSALSDTDVIMAGTLIRLEATTTVPVLDSTVEQFVYMVGELPYYRVSNQSVIIELASQLDTTPIEQEEHFVPMINSQLEYRGEEAQVEDFTLSVVTRCYTKVALIGGAVVGGVFLLKK